MNAGLLGLLGSTSLYLFLSSAPGGTSVMFTMLDGMDWKQKNNDNWA